MTETERRLKAQLDANTAQLARLTRQTQRAPQPDPYYEEPMAPPPPPDDYEPIDQGQLYMRAITDAATQNAVKAINTSQQRTAQANKQVKSRMTRLVRDFPALSDESSELVQKSRQVYARIAAENPTLDKATKYELAVREAAAHIGARPLSVAPEEADWTMGAGNNPALPSRATRSRLTPQIVANARLMGINVDPKTKEGQRNLQELSQYSARFNADVDESHAKYR